MYCSKCNMNISDDSIFCYRCGTKVVDMDFDELDKSATKNTCSNCGNEISDDSIFCYKCGNKTSSKYDNKPKFIRNICDNCGSKINSDDAFCYKCGTSTGNVSSNKYTTKNTNTQINDVSKVKDISNQITEEQSYNSENVNTQSKGIKLRRKHPFLWMCVIAIFMVVVEETSSSYLANKRSITNRMNSTNSTNSNTTTTTTYNGIKLQNIYTNKAEGISFNYPKSWKKDSSLNSTYHTVVYLKAQERQNDSAYMVVNKINKPTDDFDLSNAKSSLEEDWDEYDIEIQEIIDTKIDGVDAIKMTGTTLQGSTVVAYMYIVDGYHCQVTFNALDNTFDVYEPIFDAIMKSYKITSPTENTYQNQNTDDYGLSEEDALAAAQNFIDTHPLYDRTITDNIQYEPKSYNFSTKGLYCIETKAPDGSSRAMWIDKRTGSILFSTDNATLRDGEEVYQEVFVSKQKYDDILFDGKNVRDYLGVSTTFIYTNLGPYKYSTDISGSLYNDYKYVGYDGISFLYGDSFNIQRICGKPELFTYNDVTLNKNRDELVDLFGVPSDEDSVYNNTTGKTVSWIEFSNSNYTVRFEFESEGSDVSKDSIPYVIEIYQK